jgi:hypothetical protein
MQAVAVAVVDQMVEQEDQEVAVLDEAEAAQ